MERPKTSIWNQRPSRYFGRWRVERPENSVWNRSRGGRVGARILAVFGGWERWRVERTENSLWNRRPSRCFRRV